MATKDSSVTAAYPTIGGNGTYSYMKNSTAQGEMGDAAKLFINEAISETLNISNFSTSNAFQIADLGCSIGPNTLSAVQNILEAVKTKYQTQLLNNNKLPEFQVFFNDHASNDFNTLFKSFPKDKTYYAYGVPGSFYGRLFPHASLHFVYSSCAITWLSNVPKQVGDKSSAAWNKGRIFYSNADDEVVMAYSNQHAEDMDRFFRARAAEVVCGGLMVIIVPSRPNGVSHLEFPINVILEILGSCFMDMAKKGIIDEEKVDSFNLPTYNTSPQELEEAINRNGCFSIEKMETMPQPTLPLDVRIKSRLISMHMRASLEALIKENFGTEILDELFELFMEKLQEELPDLSVLGKAINLFVLLKRKPTEMDP